MRNKKQKSAILLLGLMLATVWNGAIATNLSDGYSLIEVKERIVTSMPKGSTIQASINGHTLMVAFSENLGQVAVEITDASGATVHYLSVLTPNGLQCYIPNTGDYVVTFTLPNGDVYYGEFTVTD